MDRPGVLIRIEDTDKPDGRWSGSTAWCEIKESLEPNVPGLLQDLLWTTTGSFLAPIADQAGCFGFAFYLLNFDTEFNYPFYSDLPPRRPSDRFAFVLPAFCWPWAVFTSTVLVIVGWMWQWWWHCSSWWKGVILEVSIHANYWSIAQNTIHNLKHRLFDL